METVVVVLFLIATIVLMCGGIVVMFFAVSADESRDFPSFLKAEVVAKVAALCLLLIALGFPVIASGNPKFYPWSYLMAAVALLADVRVFLGRRAHWATWLAAGLVTALIAAPLFLQRQ
jgi:hypothetical protein